MDWIKQNRFLAGLLGVNIVGALLFGAFSIISLKGRNAAFEAYESKAGEVDRLEGKKIYPNADHLAERKAQVAEYETSVDALQAEARKRQQPLNGGLSERQFRDSMNAEAEAIITVAAAKKLGIPEGFSLGMKKYREGASINPKAVPLLAWEMAAIKQLVSHAADSGLDSIDELNRSAFAMEDREWSPEKEAEEKAKAEADAKKAARGGRSRGRNRGRDREEAAPVLDNPMATAESVLETYRVTTLVTGSYQSLQTLLNRLAADEDYFTWLRSVRIENMVKVSPRKGEVPGPFPVPDAVPDADGKLPMVDATILFGNEKMKAQLVIDFVRFKEIANEASDADADSGEEETSA